MSEIKVSEIFGFWCSTILHIWCCVLWLFCFVAEVIILQEFFQIIDLLMSNFEMSNWTTWILLYFYLCSVIFLGQKKIFMCLGLHSKFCKGSVGRIFLLFLFILLYRISWFIIKSLRRTPLTPSTITKHVLMYRIKHWLFPEGPNHLL